MQDRDCAQDNPTEGEPGGSSMRNGNLGEGSNPPFARYARLRYHDGGRVFAMPLKPCQGCKKEVDTTAKTCPNCGRPSPAGRNGSGLRVLAGVSVILFGIFAAVSLAPTAKAPSEKRESAPAPVTTIAPPAPSPTKNRLSFAAFQDDTLVECNDIEFPQTTRLPDGGIVDPAQNFEKVITEGQPDASVLKLNRSCSEQFHDHPALATCSVEYRGRTAVAHGSSAFYSFNDVFRSDHRMKECLSMHGSWQAVSRDSETFRRAENEYNLRRMEANQARARKVLDKTMRELDRR